MEILLGVVGAIATLIGAAWVLLTLAGRQWEKRRRGSSPASGLLFTARG